MHRKVSEYNAFKLNEYQGTYEIVSGNDNDGKFYMAWGIASEYSPDVNSGVPVKKDDGKYRNVPIKVILGNREEAIENLKWLLDQLQGHDPGEPPKTEFSPEPPSDSDVPF